MGIVPSACARLPEYGNDSQGIALKILGGAVCCRGLVGTGEEPAAQVPLGETG